MGVKYIYQAGDIEEARLNELNIAYNPGSQAVLASYVFPGSIVLELGSGIGQMGKWFSSKIGDKGLYVGVDSNEEQLARAKKTLMDLTNVKLLHCDASKLSQLIDKEGLPRFDLIYCRWVLAHIPTKAQREAALKFWSTLLKEGGYLICEEADISETRCIKSDNKEFVDSPALSKWFELSKQLSDKLDIDFYISASKLSQLFDISLAQKPKLAITPGPIFSSYEKKVILPYSLTSAKKAYISAFHECTTKGDEVNQVCSELMTIASDDTLSIQCFPNTIAIYGPKSVKAQ